MNTKTLAELRALAKIMGLKGYSKLPKEELRRLLDSAHKNAAPPNNRAAAKQPPAQRAVSGESETPVAKPVSAAPAPAPVVAGDEERVEIAKYAVTPPGVPFAEPALGTDLYEDIDYRPSLTEPLLCLLPQKPGILHAYWALAPGTAARQPGLRLRFARVIADTLEVLEEFALPQEHGQWYFHMDLDAGPGAFYVQLGYYDPAGRFVTAIRRGIARIPSLYASSRVDRLWWIGEEQFRAMYLRAGGFARGMRLGWAASIGSPGAAPAARLP